MKYYLILLGGSAVIHYSCFLIVTDSSRIIRRMGQGHSAPLQNMVAGQPKRVFPTKSGKGLHQQMTEPWHVSIGKRKRQRNKYKNKDLYQTDFDGIHYLGPHHDDPSVTSAKWATNDWQPIRLSRGKRQTGERFSSRGPPRCRSFNAQG